MFIIPDEDVQAAFDWLKDNTLTMAQAIQRRGAAEDVAKHRKAMSFRLSTEKSVADRQAEAEIDPQYQAALTELREAEAHLALLRMQQSNADKMIEAWRTVQSNIRSMGKVG